MDDRSLQHWQKVIQEIINWLTELNASTEKDFLTMGAHLKDLSGKSQEITGIAVRVATLFQGEEISDEIEALKKLLNKVSDQLDESEKGLADTYKILQIILEHLRTMEKPFTSFRGIVKNLKVLGISTKIESARLASGDNGFITLAHDVENLADIIASKSAHILEKLNSLEVLIEDMLSRVLVEEDQERAKAKDIVEGIISDMSALNERRDLSGKTMLRIEKKAREIESWVGEMVASLQFHDITRQQVDHVGEVLQDWSAKLKTMDMDGDANGNSIIIADICELQSHQLENSRKEFNLAVKGAMRNLGEIVEKIRNISNDISGVLRRSGAGGKTFFDELKGDVAAIIASLRETAKAVEDLSAGIQSVVGTLNTLTAFVDEIEEIGTEIELIALNARIKAAHTGEEGAALGVLAEEVKNLSVHGRRQSTDISRGLQEIGALAVDLNVGTNYTKDAAIQETEDTVMEMDRLIGSFEKTDSEVAPMLGLMEKESEKLASSIESFLEGITIHERATAILDRSITTLNETGREARLKFPGLKTKEQTDYLRDVEKRYTMHRERNIHRELFRGVKEESLGENVELF